MTTDRKTPEDSESPLLGTRLHSYPMSKRLPASEVRAIHQKLRSESSAASRVRPNRPFLSLEEMLLEYEQSKERTLARLRASRQEPE